MEAPRAVVVLGADMVSFSWFPWVGRGGPEGSGRQGSGRREGGLRARRLLIGRTGHGPDPAQAGAQERQRAAGHGHGGRRQGGHGGLRAEEADTDRSPEPAEPTIAPQRRQDDPGSRTLYRHGWTPYNR